MSPRAARSASFLAALALSGPIATGCPPGGGGLAGPCAEVNERLGHTACVHALPDASTWSAVAPLTDQSDPVRAAKHLVPLPGTETALSPLLVNSHRWELHSDFLPVAFPDEFGDLDQDSYRELVLGAERAFLSGNLVELARQPGEPRAFAATAWDDPADEDGTLTEAQARVLLEALGPLVAELSEVPLAFLPLTEAQAQAARGWALPVAELDQTVVYEAYTRAVGFGTLRLVDASELDALTEAGELGWQDLLVLDEAPFDLEAVVGGLVTGARQAGLSHLAVRTAARGTPNCFLDEAQDLLAAYEGLLVRLECGEESLGVRSATLAEAEEAWADLRPEPVHIPLPDLETRELPGLLELPTDTAADRAAAVAAYGAKGSALAGLYQRISPELQLEGFLVPAGAYADFMAGPALGLDDAEEGESFEDVVLRWHEDEAFLSDAALRRARLEDLARALEDAPVDPVFLEELSHRIATTFGSEAVMVRVRSSSNAEDALRFSGAGLYESASACAADEWDGDGGGPSRCDDTELRERDLSRALRQVWASTWSPAAVGERLWYGIPAEDVAMALLVNTRSTGELAEAVAFSGDPVDASDDRVRVDAQAGELGVVSPEAGVLPETWRVTVGVDGRIETLDWERASTETSEGEGVLSVSEAARIGLLLSTLPTLLPLDDAVPEGQTLLYDTEWKVLSDGRLVIKQVRPFLR